MYHIIDFRILVFNVITLKKIFFFCMNNNIKTWINNFFFKYSLWSYILSYEKETKERFFKSMIILDVDAYQNISPEKNKHKIMISVPANQFNNRDTSDTSD